MKNYLYSLRLSVAILAALHFNAAGNCQALLIENFNYPSGSSLTANGWTAHSGAGNNPVLVSSQGLVFPGYPSSDIGLAALLANTGEDVNKTFATVTSGTTFCAFLVRVDTIANGYYLHFSNTTLSSNKGRVFINGTGNTFYFGLSKGLETGALTTGTPYTTGLTYLLVLKYSILAGTLNDEVSLFIMTGSIPSTEPFSPTLGPLTDGESDLNNISALALRQYSNKQDIIVDGIRVATNWADVVGISTDNKEHSGDDDPVLYPMPVKEELTISKCLNISTIEIFDLTGRKLVTIKPEAVDVVKIPVSHLSHGLYIVRFKTSDGIKIMKFIRS